MIESLVSAYQASDEEQDTYSQFNLLSRAASAEDLASRVERNEALVYVFYFQTSAYHSLADKMASAPVWSMI